jgi:hypothetical protein
VKISLAESRNDVNRIAVTELRGKEAVEIYDYLISTLDINKNVRKGK